MDEAAEETPEQSQIRSEHHHLSLFGFGFLHWNMNFLMVCTHIVGQPGNGHRVSYKERDET